MHALPLAILAFLAGLAAATAAERKLPKLNLDMPPLPAYRDLPGVKTPEEIEAERSNDGFRCTTTLRTRRIDNSKGGFSRSLPERVWLCEKNGLAVESRNPPSRGAWLPGINPPDAR